MEIDLKARHKGTNETAIYECKAHRTAVGTGPLRDFYSKFHYCRRRDRDLKAYFISTSGFTGTAKEWYDYISNDEKVYFAILDEHEILELLRRANLLNDDKLDETIRRSAGELGERYAVWISSGLFVVQILLRGGVPYEYVVLTAKGELADRLIYSEVAKLDSSLKRLSPVILPFIDRVLLNLCDLQEKSVDEVSKQITERRSDVSAALNYIKRDGFLLVNSGQDSVAKYRLSSDLAALSYVAKRLLSNDAHKLQFMQSKYLESAGDDLISFIGERFKIQFSEDQAKVIAKTVKVFPSGLLYALFGDTKNFENTANHLKELGLSGAELAKFQESNFYALMNQLILEVLNDLRVINATYLSNKGVQAYHLKQYLKFASRSELLFSIESEGNILIAKAAGKIDGGQLVSYTDPSFLLYAGDMLLALEEYEEAIKDYRRLIATTSDINLLKAACNNMGSCYSRRKMYKEALPCFEKALEYDGNLTEALKNKKLCLQELGLNGS